MTVGYDAFYGTKITDDCLIADTVSFDEETGVLTLLPCHINKEDVRAYADNEAVKSVVAAEGAILPEDSSYLFAGLDPSSLTVVAFKTNLVSIDLSKADTSNVTDMQRIFSSLKALTSLDISGFDTSEVTDMSDIFLESNALTSLDLSSFDTSKVNNTSWMFNSCQKLKTIYVSDKWNTAAITMSGSMFSGCKALVGGNGTVYDSTNVDATYARIDKEGQKGYLTMSANTAYDLTVTGTKVTYGNKGDILGDGSASYDPDTKTLTLTGDIASTTAEQAINSQLDDLTIKVEGAVNISSTYTAMFLNGNTAITGGGFIRCYGSIFCEGDLALDHLGLSFSNNGDASGLKYDALSGDGNALSVICCDISFNTDSEHYPVSNFSTVTPTDFTFKARVLKDDEWTLNDTTYNGSNFIVGTSTPVRYLVCQASGQVEGLTIDGCPISDRNKDEVLGNGVFSYDAESKTLTVNGDYTSTYSSVISSEIAGLIINTSADSTLKSSGFTVYANASATFKGDGSVLYNGVNLVISKDIDLSKYTNAYIGTTEDYKGFMGSDQIGIQIAADVTLTLLKGNVVKDEVQAYANNEAVKSVVAEEGAVLPEDCSAMFKNFKATSIDLSKADTSNVTHMGGMFYRCKSLTSLNLSSFDTSKVTVMSGMFNRCEALTALDLSSFDTSKVTNTRTMFQACIKIETIYVSDKWNMANVTDSTYMFAQCQKLVGGNGTKQGDVSIDATYARPDLDGQKGLFTINILAVPAKAATCIEAGNIEYWKDEDGKCYSDAEGKLPIDPALVVIPPTDVHQYGEPEYTWAADLGEVTAKVVCALSSEHAISETVKTVKEELPELGKIVYHAVFKDTEHFTEQTKEVPMETTTATTTATTTSATSTSSTDTATTTSGTATETTASTTQTTAATSTGEQGSTTTETKPVDLDKNLGDMNGDGKVDAKDASAVLAYYALVSTAEGDIPTLPEFARPKVS